MAFLSFMYQVFHTVVSLISCFYTFSVSHYMNLVSNFLMNVFSRMLIIKVF